MFQEPSIWEYLPALALYGTPIFVVLWAIVHFAEQRRKAIKGLAGGLAAWLACTILYFVVSFTLDPCLENCSRLRTPDGRARTATLALIYIALGVGIGVGLYRYGKHAR